MANVEAFWSDSNMAFWVACHMSCS